MSTPMNTPFAAFAQSVRTTTSQGLELSNVPNPEHCLLTVEKTRLPGDGAEPLQSDAEWAAPKSGAR